MPSNDDFADLLRRGDRITAEQWNNVVRRLMSLGNVGDAAHVISTALGKFFATSQVKSVEPDIVWVRNDTEDDLTDDHPVLGLDGPVEEPEDNANIIHAFPPVFKGVKPDEEDHLSRFGVLYGPVRAGGRQKAVVSGVAWVRIKVDDDAHEFADVEDDETSRLLTSVAGSAFILWKEDTEENERWAIVKLSNRGGAPLEILGPCAEYTPDEELEDTEFDVDFGDDCEGPSRYGMIYRSTSEVAAQTKTINIELESGTDPPPAMLYSSDTFNHDCELSSRELYVELEFTSLDMEEVELRFLLASDDSVQAIYRNTFYRWFPMTAGWLQCVWSVCDCVTFPYDVCISVPTR